MNVPHLLASIAVPALFGVALAASETLSATVASTSTGTSARKAAVAAATAPLGSPAFLPSSERPVGWRGDGTGRFPGATPPLAWGRRQNGNAYETKGIVWMTRMPAGSIAAPIVVGERIFVCANFADLLCVDKKNGRILWSCANGYFEAARDADRADPGFTATVAPLAEAVGKLRERQIEQANAAVSATGPTPAQEDAFVELAKQKRDQEIKLYDAMRGLDGKHFASKPYDQHCGTSSGTPVCDGQSVYAAFLGGVYGGSMTVVSYDLAGQRRWLSVVEAVGDIEHGNHSSMLLRGDRLIFFANTLVVAFDKKTGKELWRVKGPGYTDGISVPRVFTVGGEDAIFRAFSQANILRLADGQVISDFKTIGWLWSTPYIEDGVAYYGDRNESVFLNAVKLPERAGEKPRELYKVANPNGGKGHDLNVVASPLLYDGVVYSINEGGTLVAVDAKTGKPEYFATPFTTEVKWVVKPGVCACPTLAGDKIYLMGDPGTCVVLQPGRIYKAAGTSSARPPSRASACTTAVATTSIASATNSFEPAAEPRNVNRAARRGGDRR